MKFLLVSVIMRGIFFNSKLFHSSVKVDLSSFIICFNSLSPPCDATGLLHQEREANGPQGDGGSSRGALPNRGDAEQRGEGQGRFASSQRMSQELRTPDSDLWRPAKQLAAL